MSWIRYAGVLSTWLIVVSVFVSRAVADERVPILTTRGSSPSSSSTSLLESGLHLDWSGFRTSNLFSRMEVARLPRVSRSRRPLRQITLAGHDRFVAECVQWDDDVATFRLLSGQTIRVPIVVIASLANPPGEIDLFEQSFEGDLSNQPESPAPKTRDDIQVVDGRRSLRIDGSSPGYRHQFSTPLTSLRIEFSFRVSINDPSTDCGVWQLEWADSEARQPPLVVRVNADRRIDVTGIPTRRETSSQSLALADGWHSFIALVSPEQTRLTVDTALLASFPNSGSAIQTLQIAPGKTTSTNVLWIDGLHASRLVPIEADDRSRDESFDKDCVHLASGDDVFGRLIAVTPSHVVIDAFDQMQSLAWTNLFGFDCRQSRNPIQQGIRAATGIVSRVEMQPFADRPECKPERWTVTIVRIDSDQLIVQHAVAGEMTFRWSDIRRIEPLFFGQCWLLDARRFHLGNSIRSDFRRHSPDGTEIRGTISLPEIPRGQPFLSLDVAEIEAAASNAPPGSPFLAELRAGQLITEVFVNDRRVGDLNSLIRFKASSQNPDRVRLAFPRDFMKIGENSFRLSQKPLKASGREFDDGEIGNIQLEFEMRD